MGDFKQQNYVFVVDTKGQPLNPIHPGRARKLLHSGKAAVWRTYPFTIVLKRAIASPIGAPNRIKLDPGSLVTGIALVNDLPGVVFWAAELTHRGDKIRAKLAGRRVVRRNRRCRKTRYRQAKFNNRKRKDGWLAPSLRPTRRNNDDLGQSPAVVLPKNGHLDGVGAV